MYDINPKHLNILFRPFDQEVAEHYRYLDELNALDMREEQDAKRAIQTWVIPIFQRVNERQRFQIKEALRFYITTGRGGATCSFWRPGIDDLQDIDVWSQENNIYYLLLWRVLFDEPFIEAVISNYRTRVDWNFSEFPGFPEKWETPSYER